MIYIIYILYILYNNFDKEGLRAADVYILYIEEFRYRMFATRWLKSVLERIF